MKQSMNTKRESYAFEIGRSVMKLYEIDFQVPEGMGNGISLPH